MNLFLGFVRCFSSELFFSSELSSSESAVLNDLGLVLEDINDNFEVTSLFLDFLRLFLSTSSEFLSLESVSNVPDDFEWIVVLTSFAISEMLSLGVGISVKEKKIFKVKNKRKMHIASLNYKNNI